MASGTLEFGTSNAAITGRVVWSSSSNGPVANSSNVYVTLQYYRRDGYTTYGTLNGTIYIDGAGYGVSQYVGLTASSGWVTIGSASRVVGHNSDGTRVINIGANGAISGTTLSSSSGSWNVGLDTIPRYTSITKWTADEVGQTSAKFSWQTADTCDFARVYLNNNTQHTDIPGGINGFSGSFTYTGMTTGSAAIPAKSTLFPGTAYNLKIQVRRKDSQLWTTSGNYLFTTAPIASLTANTSVDFNIGQNLSLTFINYNNNKSYLSLDVQKPDGTWEKNVVTTGETLQVANYVWQLSTSATALYAKVTTRNSANIRVRCGTTINGIIYENTVQGVMTVVNSAPAFSTYSFGNADTKTQTVLGNTSNMPENFGDMQAHISVANRATAKNQATIIKYMAYITDSKNVIRITKELPYSTTAQIDVSFGNFSTAGTYLIKIYAIDSRGNESPTVLKTFYVLSYHRPQTTITMQRENGYEKEYTVSLTSLYSKLMLNGVVKNTTFNVKYRYCIAGEAMNNTYYTINGLTSVDYSTTDKKATYTKSPSGQFTPLTLDPTKTFNFEFIVSDKISEVTETCMVAQGIPIFMEADNGKVSVGMVPDWNSPANLQVATDILATDTKGNKRLVLADIDKKNADLFNIIYPVGICIEFAVNVNPNTIYPNTSWARDAQGRVVVGVNESDSDFNTVGKTGGTKLHTLTISEMPSHNHRLGFRTNTNITTGSSGQWTVDPGTYTDYGNTSVIENTGGGKSHNNIQPYITRYKWTRVS